MILKVGDDVSNLKIYEIINKYFGKDYKGWMQAWFDIDDNYAAWFPRITETNERPDGSYGGTQNCSNVLSADRTIITEVDHDAKSSLDINPRFLKKRLVFGRINGKFVFLGIFHTNVVKDAEHATCMHIKIADAIDLDKIL